MTTNVSNQEILVNPSSLRTRIEYVWIDGDGQLRSKIRTCIIPQNSPQNIPTWSYDGSSTGQSSGHDSDVLLYPVCTCLNPLSSGPSLLALCHAVLPNGTPARGNHRQDVLAIQSTSNGESVGNISDESLQPWFAFEQEYVIYDPNTSRPLGWTDNYPKKINETGPYYCGVGTFGRCRKIAERHYNMCLQAGLSISGINAEVMPSQWEFQIGPCQGVHASDQLWIARYFLLRIAEEENVNISFHPKPEGDDWNGSGLHTNFSTVESRAEGGLETLIKYAEKLANKHDEHIAVYGKDNDKRLTGTHETASINTFSWGIANRSASVRIPRHVASDGKGYLEDRRPASNADPYLVSARILLTVVD